MLRLRADTPDRKYYFLFFIGVLAVLAPIMIFSPFTVDDLFFRQLQLSGLQEKFQYALYYGNGRFLGNLGVLVLIDNTLLRVIVKTLVVGLSVLLTCLLLNNKSKSMSGIVFLLFIGMCPGLFGETIVWTSGMQNYFPPILCMLLCVYIMRNYKQEQTVIKRVVSMALVFILGVCGQLFIEHSTLINGAVAFALVIYAFKSQKFKRLISIIYLLATGIGAAIMILIPKWFYLPHPWENYQSFNLGNVKELFISVLDNGTVIQDVLSQSILLLFILSLSFLLVLRQRKKEKKGKGLLLCKGAQYVLVFYPIFCVIKFVLYNFELAAYFGPVFKLFCIGLLLLYFGALLYSCLQIKPKETRQTMLVMLGFVFLSIVPLLVVNPVSKRNILHGYVFLIFFGVTLLQYVKENGLWIYNNNYKKLINGTAAALSLSLIFLFYNFYSIYSVQETDISQKMEQEATEIAVLGKYPLDYVYDGKEVYPALEKYYYYNQPGDITFTYLSFREWNEVCRNQ